MRLILSTILGSFLILSPFAGSRVSGQEQPTRLDNRMTKEEVAAKFSAEERASVISSRESFLLENATNNFASATWMRDVYRIVDETEASNAAFFLPNESGKEFVNLFSLLLNLLNLGEIDAYRFDSDAITIEEKGTVTLPEIFDLNNIPFTLRLDNTLSFSRLDLPASDVKSYYIKEKWIFDQRTGKGDVIPVAICPVLHHQESYDFFDVGVLKTPLFWVHVEDIAPYLHKAITPGALSTLSKLGNNVSLFDVLRSRLYEGDIYQIGIRNLMKYANSPEELKQQQLLAEAELQQYLEKFRNLKK